MAESDAVSVAKKAMWGTIIAAAIAAVAAIVVAIVSAVSKDPQPQTSPVVTPTTTATQAQPPAGAKGNIDSVTVSQDGTRVTVTGTTSAEVVAVLVGPRPGGVNGYWAAGEVINKFDVWVKNPNGPQTVSFPWNVVVNTDPHVTSDYTVRAFYDSNPTPLVSGPETSRPSTTSDPGYPAGPAGPGGPGGPVPLDVQATINAAINCGDKCLGPPSVYQGKVGP